MKCTKEEAELTKQNLLKTAMSEFIKKGFEESTLEGIAKKARVTRGAIYWHFKDKEDLYRALIKMKDKESVEALKEIYESDLSPLEKLKKLAVVNFPDLKNPVEFRNYIRIKIKLYNFHIRYNDEAGVSNTILKYLELTLKQAKKLGLIKQEVNIYVAAYSILGLIAGITIKNETAPYKFNSMKSLQKILTSYLKLIEN